MKLEAFFEKFNLFADLPEAIRSMRELILQLAVRGKLTNQTANESARPQQELSESFRIRRLRRGEPDSEDVPFYVPKNWAWVAVGDAMEMVNGKAFKAEDWCSEGTPIIRIQNLNNENAGFNRCKTEVDPRVHVHDGDFLISWSGTPGTSFGAFIWNRGFAYLNQHIFRCELVKGVFLKEFLRLAINARLDEMISHAQGAVGLRHITKGKLESIRLPLPPLAEQKRIVAKVDDLMSLCDCLTLLQEEREIRHAALARASLERFADAPTPANLLFLFHPAYAIPPADLRKSILTLAVQGKVVPQDPNDEPAEDLLVRCNVERQMIGRATPTTVQAIKSVETLGYEIPPSWEWRSLGDLLILGPTNGFSPKAVDHETPVRSLTLSATTSGRFKGEHSKFITTDIPVDSDLWLRDGDILVQRGNTIEYVGVAAVYRGKPNAFIYPDLMMKLRVSSFIDIGFVHLAMSQEAARDFLRARASGTSGSMPKINQGTLKSLPIPIPPLPEQRRIVAKVNELMALVDQLEEQLCAATKQGGALLESAVHELLSPSAEIMQFASTHSASFPDRAAIGCYAIQQLAERPTFGRTALVKVLYLAEAHIGLELGGQYLRDAAGPLDQWIYTFEGQAAEQQWFSVVERSTNDGHKKIEYRKGPNLSTKAVEVTTRLSRELQKEFDGLLALLSNKPTVEVEIIATLFAAWNDSLIDGHAPSDAEITRDVRENWHPSKQRFKEPELRKWLDWMRQHSLVPKGRGPRTCGSKAKLRLHGDLTVAKKPQSV
jgi:type I restriction enzyme, S subunit